MFGFKRMIQTAVDNAVAKHTAHMRGALTEAGVDLEGAAWRTRVKMADAADNAAAELAAAADKEALRRKLNAEIEGHYATADTHDDEEARLRTVLQTIFGVDPDEELTYSHDDEGGDDDKLAAFNELAAALNGAPMGVFEGYGDDGIELDPATTGLNDPSFEGKPAQAA